MTIDTITIYPVKSAKGTSLGDTAVLPYGLQYDRNWALFDADGKVITARQFPQILRMSTLLEKEHLIIYKDGKAVLQLPIRAGNKAEGLEVFKEKALGYNMGEAAHLFFSSFLQTNCYLMFMGHQFARNVAPKYGGQLTDVVGYADECPLLLISQASLEDLNSRLETPVTMQHFRPNLTVAHCEPYEEDTWKKIRIGSSEFEVSQQCKRCVFTTIDPNTQEKSPDQEPLRTLASYRKHPRGGTAFGVHLIPRKTGQININDKVEVIG